MKYLAIFSMTVAGIAGPATAEETDPRVSEYLNCVKAQAFELEASRERADLVADAAIFACVGKKQGAVAGWLSQVSKTLRPQGISTSREETEDILSKLAKRAALWTVIRKRADAAT